MKLTLYNKSYHPIKNIELDIMPRIGESVEFCMPDVEDVIVAQVEDVIHSQFNYPKIVVNFIED